MSGISQGTVTHFFPKVPDFDDGTGGLVVKLSDFLPVCRSGRCEDMGMEILMVQIATRLPGLRVGQMYGQVCGEPEPLDKSGGELSGKINLAGMGKFLGQGYLELSAYGRILPFLGLLNPVPKFRPVGNLPLWTSENFRLKYSGLPAIIVYNSGSFIGDGDAGSIRNPSNGTESLGS